MFLVRGPKGWRAAKQIKSNQIKSTCSPRIAGSRLKFSYVLAERASFLLFTIPPACIDGFNSRPVEERILRLSHEFVARILVTTPKFADHNDWVPHPVSP